MISVIRLSPPRHAIRRERVGFVRHPATKVVATPLVTATTLLAMDSAGFSSSAIPHTKSTSTDTGGVRHTQAFAGVTQTTIPAPTTTTVVTTPPATATTGTPVHLQPTTTTRPRPRPAPKPAPRPAPASAAIDPLVAAARAPHTAKTVALGDYAGGGNVGGVQAFAAATGAHPTIASDYLIGSEGWNGMDGAGGSESWMLNQWRPTGLRLVVGVPIIPDGTGGTLAQGAAGAYNQYFTTLAQTLVAGGAGNAILRLGWEFNGNWFNWSVANNTDAQNFAAYWRQIVNTMRAVPGQQFGFLWNPNNGNSSSWNVELAYPGSAYVDYVGTDVYDEYWGSPKTAQASWSWAVNQSYGLNWLVNFAAREGRPIAVPEWSVTIRSDGFGLDDDPYFVQQFGAWVAANDVAFTCIFSYNDSAGSQDNDITDGLFPNALTAFRATFG
jgi:hypothetical protein